MATCQEITATATIWAEGGLTPAERQAFDAHLVGCEGCRTYVRQLEVTRASLARLPAPEMTPALEREILKGFDAWVAAGNAVPVPAPASRRFSPLPVLASLAVMGLLVAFARQRSESPDDWLIAAVLALLSLGAAVVVGRFAVGVVIAAVGAAAAAALAAGHGGGLEISTGVECFLAEVLAAAVLAGATWFGLRQGAPAMYRRAIVGGPVAGALAADAALHVTCHAHGALPHLLVFHLGGVIVVSLVMLAFARSHWTASRSSDT